MGLGRREFIRMVGSAVAGFTLAPGQAVAVYNDLYLNRRLGVAFTKPRGWQYADMREMGMVKEGQLLALEDPERAKEIVKYASLPIVTISKETLASTSDRFTPGVHVFVDKADSRADPERIVSLDISECRILLNDFVVLDKPRISVVSNYPSVSYVSSFLFRHQALRTPVPVRLRSLIAITPASAIFFRMYDSPETGDVYDYEPFTTSIWLM